MKSRQHAPIERPWIWCAAIVVASALVGLWKGQTPIAPLSTSPSQSSMLEKPVSMLEKIEAELAQAGCPGWITLASEGEQALEATAIVPGNIQQTSRRIPHVVYPVPLRVASRTLVAAVGSADDPDDLLDGVPDLLAKPQAEAPVEDAADDLELLPAEVATPEEAVAEDGTARSEPLPTLQKPMVEEMPSPLPIPNPPVPNPPPSSPFAPPPAPSTPAPHSLAAAPASDQRTPCEFIADCQYPSAEACRKCHQRNYDEWSVSSHAYATISPMFHKFEQKINDLSFGTIGYFCYRCHSPVGTTLGISRAAPLWDLPPVAREGVTCVVCHRVNERFGKVNGERRIEPGDIHAPVYGSIGGSGVAEVIANANKYKVKTSPHDPGPGQDIHAAGVHFDQLVVSSGGRPPGHQAGSRLGTIPRLAGLQERRFVSGLSHGSHPGRSEWLCRWPRGQGERPDR